MQIYSSQELLELLQSILDVDKRERSNRIMVKGAKSIAEYAFRRWMERENFQTAYFKLEMTGTHEAVIRDQFGESLRLVYDPGTRNVLPIF